MNEDVKLFLESVQVPWQAELCVSLRDAVQQAIPDMQERIQYKKPHFLKNGKYAAVISTSKDAVSFTIFNAAELTLPGNLFDGPPERKTIKLRSGELPVELEQLSTWVKEAASGL
ncbi:DUF1801 domain-containing protein [Paenibacillus kobensis]|uniref:DUF1801 domain-containing protein n=1 Tax=Paenibacillus kobensis TaxID=59841 RepID=UPI000FDAE6C6|nr:DUF1801 domain-containing protein [Paenibacillus kobensis]